MRGDDHHDGQHVCWVSASLDPTYKEAIVRMPYCGAFSREAYLNLIDKDREARRTTFTL
jgi:hypothetical protein